MRHETVVVPFVDLGHPIEHNMTPDPALPGPRIADHLSRAAARRCAELHIGRIDMPASTGKYC